MFSHCKQLPCVNLDACRVMISYNVTLVAGPSVSQASGYILTKYCFTKQSLEFLVPCAQLFILNRKQLCHRRQHCSVTTSNEAKTSSVPSLAINGTKTWVSQLFLFLQQSWHKETGAVFMPFGHRVASIWNWVGCQSFGSIIGLKI